DRGGWHRSRRRGSSVREASRRDEGSWAPRLIVRCRLPVARHDHGLTLGACWLARRRCDLRRCWRLGSWTRRLGRLVARLVLAVPLAHVAREVGNLLRHAIEPEL